MAAEFGDRGSNPWPDIIIGSRILTTHAQKQAAINGMGWGFNYKHTPREFWKKKMNLSIKKGGKYFL